MKKLYDSLMFGLFPEDKNSTHQTAQVTSNFHLLGNFASCIGEWARTKGKPCYVKSFGNIKFINDPYDKEVKTLTLMSFMHRSVL